MPACRRHTARPEPSDDSEQLLNLCFHGVGEPRRELETDEERYWVSVARFRELLDVIAPHPHIRISFDDGNASDAAVALPELRERELCASFFVIAGRTGQSGSLSADGIRELVAGGMTVGLHGMVHRPWRHLTGVELELELGKATEIITELSGRPVRDAACPFGAYDRRVLAALRRRGFTRVYTVDGGTARAGGWLQSRYTVRSTDTPAVLERMIQSPHGTRGASLARRGKSLIKRMR